MVRILTLILDRVCSEHICISRSLFFQVFLKNNREGIDYLVML